MNIFIISSKWTNHLKSISQRKLVNDVIFTTIYNVIGKSIGFMIPLVIAGLFGISARTDSFFFVYGMILFLSGIFASVIEYIIVPYIAEAKSKNEDVGKLVGNFLGVTCWSFIAVCVVFPLVIKIVLPIITNFNANELKLIYKLSVFISPIFVFSVWNSILTGTFNAYKKFVYSALAPGVRGIVNLVIIFLFKDMLGVFAIALGYVTGEVLRFGFLLSIIYRLDFLKLRLSFHSAKRLREIIKTGFYQVIGMIAVGLMPIVDKTMVSWLGDGSISILHYADRLYMVFVTFLTGGLMITILSHWSENYYKSGRLKLNEDVKKAAKITGLIAMLIIVPIIFLNQPVVSFLLGWGVFPQAKLSEVNLVMLCYLLGFIPNMIGLIFVQAHLILKNTKALMKCGLYLSVLNILFNLILVQYFGVAGIALSTAVLNFFSLAYLNRAFYQFKYRI